MTTGQIGGRSTTVPAYRDIVHDWLRIALDNPADHLGSAALLTQYQNLAWDVHDAIPIKEDASLYDYDMPCVAVIRGGAFPDPTLGDLKGEDEDPDKAGEFISHKAIRYRGNLQAMGVGQFAGHRDILHDVLMCTLGAPVFRSEMHDAGLLNMLMTPQGDFFLPEEEGTAPNTRYGHTFSLEFHFYVTEATRWKDVESVTFAPSRLGDLALG